MNFIRKAMVASLTTVLVVLLFSLAFEVGVLRSAGNAGEVKKVLADSGVYDTLVPNLLNQTKNISTSAGNLQLNNPKVQSAAESALTPTQIQNDSNQIIDSVYAWLNGKQATPQFSIDLSGIKASFANNMATVVQQQAIGLPTCTTDQSTNVDIFNATCLPPGVTPTQAGNMARDQILNSQGFLGNKDSITPQDVKNGNSNQNVFNDQLKQLPSQYRKVKRTPYVLGILAVLAAVGIVFLSSSRRRGVRRVAIALAAVGLFMLLFAWGLNREATHTLIPKISVNNAATQTALRKVVTDLVQAIDKNYWIFGIIYAVLGAAALASDRLILSKLNHNSSEKKPKPVSESLV